MLVRNNRTLSSTARLVFLVLTTHSNAQRIAWPSAETLASETGLSQRQVSRGVVELVTAGWLSVGKRARRAGGYVNEYTLHPVEHGAAQAGCTVPNSHHAPCPTGTPRIASQAHKPIHLEPIHSEPILNRTAISDLARRSISDGARARTSTGVRGQDQSREAKEDPSASEDPRTRPDRDPTGDPRVQALVRHHLKGHLRRTGCRPAPLSRRGARMAEVALARHSLRDLVVGIQNAVSEAWEVHEGQLEDILEPGPLAANVRRGRERYPRVVDAVIEGDKLVVVIEPSTSGKRSATAAQPPQRTGNVVPIGSSGVR